MSSNKKHEELLQKYPERSRTLKNYAKNRNWIPAYDRQGKHMGLSLQETKAFGNWMWGKTALPSAGQKLEIETGEDGLVIRAKGHRIKTLEDLLTSAEVNPDKWIVTRYKVNTWEVASRSPDGQATITPVWQVKADLEPRRLNVLKEVKPLQVLKREPPKARREGIKRALFIPDSQHGFRWVNKYKRLEPLHDRKAIDSIVQLAVAFQPDVICLLGDMADFAVWSTKYPRDPTMRQTTQPVLEELHWQLAQLRLACPRARIVYTAGNHEARIEKSQIQYFDESIGLRFANDDAEEPILHMRRLLALDALDIEYVGPYNTDWWLWNRVRVHHGSTVRTGGGGTVAARVKEGDWPEVFGHIHRMELAQRVVHGPHGPKIITAMSPGCLCRTDGVVPGVSKTPDWHHGVGIGYYDEVNDADHLHVIPIHNGRLVFDGRVFIGEDRAEEIAEATGYTQIAYTE